MLSAVRRESPTWRPRGKGSERKNKEREREREKPRTHVSHHKSFHVLANLPILLFLLIVCARGKDDSH